MPSENEKANYKVGRCQKISLGQDEVRQDFLEKSGTSSFFGSLKFTLKSCRKEEGSIY